MKSLKDTFRLGNGEEIPCIGYGTWQLDNGKATVEAVEYALQAGYRHIDTAAVYDNEESVGMAIAGSGIRREEIFVTSKVWNTDRGYEPTLKAFDISLKKLGLDHLDLYLIHWPSNKPDGATTNAETWRALEKLYGEGAVRSIGVSNFLPNHLEPLMKSAKIMPMVDQIEHHPGFRQQGTVEFCRSHGILVEGWSPLGRGRVLDDPALKTIAARHGKSPAQVCIRWSLQSNVLPLPKSVTPARIVENADVFDFDLSAEDMRTINSLPVFGNSGLDPDTITF